MSTKFRHNDTVMIDRTTVMIGPVIDRSAMKWNYFKANVKIRHKISYPNELIIGGNISDYLWGLTIDEPNNVLILNYGDLKKKTPFDIESVVLDNEKSVPMTDIDLINDLDYIQLEILNIRKIINTSTDSQKVNRFTEILFSKPHEIFRMNTAKEYYDYLDKIDVALKQREKLAMEKVNDTVKDYSWS